MKVLYKILTYLSIISGIVILIICLMSDREGMMLIGVLLVLLPAIVGLGINTFSNNQKQKID